MTDPNDIMNWRRLDARVTTSGQPTTTQLVEIADLGVVHVINLGLHTHPHALADERGDVERLGMKYTHIPVDFAAPTDEDFEKFQKAFESTSPDKVHVHCIFNWRVSAFFYRYQRYVQTSRSQESAEPGTQLRNRLWIKALYDCCWRCESVGSANR